MPDGFDDDQYAKGPLLRIPIKTIGHLGSNASNCLNSRTIKQVFIRKCCNFLNNSQIWENVICTCLMEHIEYE